MPKRQLFQELLKKFTSHYTLIPHKIIKVQKSPKIQLLRMAAAKYSSDQSIAINQKQNENRAVSSFYPNPALEHLRTDSHDRGQS